MSKASVIRVCGDLKAYFRDEAVEQPSDPSNENSKSTDDVTDKSSAGTTIEGAQKEHELIPAA